MTGPLTSLTTTAEVCNISVHSWPVETQCKSLEGLLPTEVTCQRDRVGKLASVFEQQGGRMREPVTLRCAHGDTVLYPLAEVNISVGGLAFVVRAAPSETMPVSVLLGTDVPELGQLLHKNVSDPRCQFHVWLAHPSSLLLENAGGTFLG